MQLPNEAARGHWALDTSSSIDRYIRLELVLGPDPPFTPKQPKTGQAQAFHRFLTKQHAARTLAAVSIKNPSRERAFSLAKNFATLLNED